MIIKPVFLFSFSLFPDLEMSADSFGAGGSDAQQSLQSFWPRVMEEIRNLTVVRIAPFFFYPDTYIHKCSHWRLDTV